MKRGPTTDFVAKARASWDGRPPAWVTALAEEATRSSGARAAKRIGYSPAVVTHVIANTYTGDLKRVAEKVRGALMGVTVQCPVLGEIGRDRCLDEQAVGFCGTSSIRSRLYRACRSGCPHSQLAKE
jgi:hypothetical protein